MAAASETDRSQLLHLCVLYEYSALHLYLLHSGKFRKLWEEKVFDLHRLCGLFSVPQVRRILRADDVV
jgi:hypothetical protein